MHYYDIHITLRDELISFRLNNYNKINYIITILSETKNANKLLKTESGNFKFTCTNFRPLTYTYIL